MIPMSHDPVTSLYLSDAWKHHENLVLHFSEFSENILLITAPYQAGKSTFLNYLLEKDNPSLNRIKIDAPADSSVDALIKVIEASFEDDERIPVLFIDDAHRLSDLQVEALLQLKFHLVLIGEPSLELRLFSSRWQDCLQGKIYTIELEPWSLQDLKTFWMNDPFAPRLNENQFMALLEESGGLPGEVARCKEEVLLQAESKGMTMQNINVKQLATHPVCIGMMVGVLIGGSYLLFSGSNEVETNMVSMELADVSEEKWEEEASYVLPKAGMVAAVAKAETQAKPVKAVEEPIIEEIVAEVEALETVKKIEKIKPVEKVANAKAQLSEQEKKLLDLKGDHYTLQLIGARGEKNIKQFVSRHGLKNAYCYRTKLSGKDWYVVVYGEYPSREAAIKAIAAMPASLRKENLKPWIREINGVHRDLTDRRQA